MKMRTLFIVVLSAFLFWGFALADNSATKDTKKETNSAQNETSKTGQAITWHKYDEGLALAKKSGKKVFLEFTAKWCGWCKRMKATTFKNPEVIDMLNRYYVAVSIDGDSHDSLNVDGWLTTEKGVAREFGIRSYPTFWFLETNGDKIAPLKGYRDSNSLTAILDYLKDDTYKTMKFDEFMAKKRKEKSKK